MVRLGVWQMVAVVGVMMMQGWPPQMAAGACSKALTLANGSEHTFVNCVDLGVQAASLAWTLTPPSASSDFNVLELAFFGNAPSASGWVGWGLNPTKPQMVGSSTFLSYNAPNGSNLLPYRLTSATVGGAPLVCSPIDYIVQSSAVEISGVSMSMLLTLNLNASSPTSLYHVWNRGPSVTNFRPAPHALLPDDLKAVTQINMSSGFSSSATQGSGIQLLKRRHGLINAVAWVFLLPTGVIFARYLKPFAGPIWFYMHIFFQCSGYVLGASGWATGLKLGSASPGVVFQKHRDIGMALFALSSLQVMALLVRPKKKHALRSYWNVYHHTVGYSIIALGIVNVFIGMAILGVSGWPYHIFICTLVAFGAIALVLEGITWSLFIKQWRNERTLRDQSTTSHSYPKRTSNVALGPTEHVLRVL